MNNYRLTIIGILPTLNEYIDAERSSKYLAAKIKKSATELVAWQAKTQLDKIEGLHEYTFFWNEPTRTRDPDNISHAVKYVFDGLVMGGTISNDGWKNVGCITHLFVHHKGADPYVEVRIREVLK